MSVSQPLVLPACLRIGPGRRFGLAPARVDFELMPPDARALDRIGAEFALRHGVLPLRPAGAITPVAASSASAFLAAQPLLEEALGDVSLILADAVAIEDRIATLRGQNLSWRASERTAISESSRGWSRRRAAGLALLATAAFALLASLWPTALLIAVTVWAALSLLAVTGLRTLAALVEANQARRLGRAWSSKRYLHRSPESLPTISILVPLFDEQEIAQRLVARLERLDYPSKLLEVFLILEAGDRTTRAAIDAATLPPWMRILAVPAGQVRTKPRAMNYALDFAHGDVVGIYDAEDAPAPDQLLRVAEAFRSAGPDLACVQGVLDFYNARQTWLTRCFAIDYAMWFRLVLPGLVRQGFAIPLGGTTVFIRREILDRLGRWDAHNVTEDADLGIRLARRGFRVAFVATVTDEEATASIPAWIRQRSRWIKGYAVTWAVHMRDPLRLWGEMGPWRFLGFQILFLGTLSQFILAPVLWSFWLVIFGLPHPFTNIAPWGAAVTLGALFILSEIATLGVAALAVATPRHRWLIKWVPLMNLYFPLAAVASWKGYAELLWKPFYWDKTAHGRNVTPRQADPGVRPPRRLFSGGPRRHG